MCTGNTCRSPMAAALLRRDLLWSGIDVDVHSAGTLGWAGSPASPHAAAVMHERGLDLDGHVSRKLDRDLVARADLVVAMTRDHAGAAVARDASKAPVTFLPGELARLGWQAGPRVPTESLRDWVDRTSRQRSSHRPVGRAAEEVADPAGEPVDVYRRTADRLERALAAVASLMAGRVEPRQESAGRSTSRR